MPTHEITATKIRFPAYRRFDAARIEANNAMVGMLVGSRLSEHLLHAHRGAAVMLPEIYPSVHGVDLLNRSVADAQQQIAGSEGHLTTMAVPFLQAVFEDLASSAVQLCRMRGHIPTRQENSQGLAGTLGFLERCSGATYSAVHRELFDFLRQVRNHIVHEGSRATPRLTSSWTQLPPQATGRWESIAGRSYQLAGDHRGRIVLEAPELTVALAVTKRMAVETCGHLANVLLDQDWAEVVVDDYDTNVEAVARRSTILREVRSYARREYTPVQPSDASLRAVLTGRGVL